MPSRLTLAAFFLLSAVLPSTGRPNEPGAPSLDQQFGSVIQPFLKSQCLGCHGPKNLKGKLDLSTDSTPRAIARNHRVWALVLERLEAEEMPPEDAAKQPTAQERRAVVAWIQALREREARTNAGDPGPVLAHRLSNAEYDYSIRDLTGVDLRPTREFPVDPANEAGFDNSGESLATSPTLVRKYLAAARGVADHLVLKPDGLAFAPEPAITDTDRDKYCVQRIVAFYDRHSIDIADYFLAAWRFQNRDAHGRPRATPTEIAAENGLSARYLATIVKALSEPAPPDGPLGQVQSLWKSLPTAAERRSEAQAGCARMRDLVNRLRERYKPRVESLIVRGISPGSQPMVLWKDRQFAARRMSAPGDDNTPDECEFCRVFPDRFAVSERPPYFDKSGGKGRLLTAGFHLMQGYFRDDDPLQELVLDEADRREIDALWHELDFVTLVPIRQYKDFIFFERAEPPRFMKEAAFDFARSEDKDATTPSKMKQLQTAYIAKAEKNGANKEALDAIQTYFSSMSRQIRAVETARKAAEPRHLQALERFTARAYRRPLSPPEKEELLAFYRGLRQNDGLSHEDAVRDTITSVLISPHFCFLVDLSEPGAAPRPLSNYALASRLSYFLWSSIPDEELLSHAAAGDLHEPTVLIGQARRMLQDDRVRALAVEFAGQWLDFRRFEEHNGVDRARFKSFTNELRQAMYEEPIRFFLDVARRNGSVLDFLDADHTFVSPVLAKHYGMPVPDGNTDAWVRVDAAHEYGRGGLLPMGVFLTANSPGLRTSPVKRGYWVVRRLLGEHVPAPPPVVPELPKDEATTGERTLPQLLAQHRENPNCAACHQRFDSIGLVFEDYGPIGERRDRDLAGRPVDTQATFPDGRERTGMNGLRRYLMENRREEFLDNLERKLLAYALGRGLLLSDESTLKTMHARLLADGHRFDSLIESIVASPQFLMKRGKDDRRD